jgi:DNA-binding transcriptional regulator YiaG
MDNLTASEIIDRLGGTTEVARICRIKPPSVSEWRATGIPPARRQFLELLRPEAFVGSSIAAVRQLVDRRMSKRALREKLGLSTDKQLAKLLKLPVEQVEAWADDDMVPALPQVMKLLGHTEHQEPAKPANDPDADRIAPIEVA